MSVFLTIKETATRSGLSQFYIRNRCKDGTIPHRMMGIKYMVDYEASPTPIPAQRGSRSWSWAGR